MDRQQRHDLKHDKFVDEIGNLSTKARANQRVLFFIGGAIVAIALIAFGIHFFRSSREDNAQQLLATAITTFEAPVGEATPQQQVATPAPRFKTEAERNAAAEKQFRDVQAQYGSSDAADIAGLYLGRIAVAKGDAKAARAHFEEFVDDHEDHILVGAARYSLYQLRIENGEAAQVTTELTAELARPEPSLPGDSLLMLLAQAHEIQGQPDRAREAYRRITTEFPESPYAIEAQRRVGA